LYRNICLFSCLFLSAFLSFSFCCFINFMFLVCFSHVYQLMPWGTVAFYMSTPLPQLLLRSGRCFPLCPFFAAFRCTQFHSARPAICPQDFKIFHDTSRLFLSIFHYISAVTEQPQIHLSQLKAIPMQCVRENDGDSSGVHQASHPVGTGVKATEAWSWSLTSV
jgi:hypothetical protein